MEAIKVLAWAVLRLFANAVWLCVCLPIALLGMLVTWNTDASIWVARRLWSPVLVFLGGAKLEVIGGEHVDPQRPTLYLSNHQSTIDIPVLIMALPVNLRFVAKSQLRWVPLLGWYLWIAKHVFVDRSNRRRAIGSLEQAGRRIRSGTSIIVFPEGTRSPDGRLLPFKKGPFVLALKAQVPICPVTIEGSGRLMPKNSWKVTPGPIRVKVGAPIKVEGLSDDDREALMSKVRSVMIQQSLELGGQGGDLEDAVDTTAHRGSSRRVKRRRGSQ